MIGVLVAIGVHIVIAATGGLRGIVVCYGACLCAAMIVAWRDKRRQPRPNRRIRCRWR